MNALLRADRRPFAVADIGPLEPREHPSKPVCCRLSPERPFGGRAGQSDPGSVQLNTNWSATPTRSTSVAGHRFHGDTGP